MCLSMPYTDYSNSAPWATKHYFNHKIVCSKINITSYSHTYLISNIQYKNIWRIILTAWQTFNSCCDFTVLRPLLSHIHINYLFSTFLYEILLFLVEVIVISIIGFEAIVRNIKPKRNLSKIMMYISKTINQRFYLKTMGL